MSDGCDWGERIMRTALGTLPWRLFNMADQNGGLLLKSDGRGHSRKMMSIFIVCFDGGEYFGADSGSFVDDN